MSAMSASSGRRGLRSSSLSSFPWAAGSSEDGALSVSEGVCRRVTKKAKKPPAARGRRPTSPFGEGEGRVGLGLARRRRVGEAARRAFRTGSYADPCKSLRRVREGELAAGRRGGWTRGKWKEPLLDVGAGRDQARSLVIGCSRSPLRAS